MAEEIIQKNNNIKEEDLNLSRDNLLQQISTLKEKFNSLFDSIKSNFVEKYDNYYSQLFEQLKKQDEIIGKYINKDEELDNYKKKVIEILQKILGNLNENHKIFSEDIKNLCDNLCTQISNRNIKEIEGYVNQIKEGKEKEKKSEEVKEKKIEGDNIKKIEENNKKKLEEDKKNEIEEETKKQLEEEGKKEFNFIELDGTKNKEININSLKDIDNYNKIIIKDMSKEDLEYLFKKKNLRKKSDENIKTADLEGAQNEFFLEGEDNFNIQRSATISGIKNKVNLNGGHKDINSVTNIIFKKTVLENMEINELFPNIKKLKIEDSKIGFEIGNKFNFKNLQKLKLENIGLIDNNFNELFDFIRNDKQIRNNLKLLSVKNNKISYIDYKRGYADNILSSMIFNKLEVLDMSYNKLYFFQNQMFNCLEKIKFIDLTDNNISFPNNILSLIKSSKKKNCLLLITRNLGLLKEQENIIYNNYLKEILPNINYPVKKLTFDNIFCNKLYQNIKDLDFSYFKASLSYIDLSDGQLNDNDLIFLFNNKLPFSNLKTLILTANHLTQEFLYAISSDNKYSMDKLKLLKLSENNIKCTNLEKFEKFLEFFKNLEIFELKCTPFESIINQYFKQKTINYHDPTNKKGFTRDLNEDEKNIEYILNYLKEKNKLKIYILDLNGGKYIEKIYQNFPDLTFGLDIENKFPHKT